MTVNEVTINMKGIEAVKVKTDIITFNDAAVPVIIALHKAINAHDMDATLALFADDAVVNFPGQLPPNILTGKEQIRTGWLESDFANNVHIEVGNFQVADDKLIWMATISWDFLRPLGIASLEGMGKAIVQGGKIKSFTAIFPPGSLAKMEAGIAKE